jgi:hypothetical protein
VSGQERQPVIEATGGVEIQHARFAGADGEAVRRVGRDPHRRTGAGGRRAPVDRQLQFALENVEALGGPLVHVGGRSVSPGHQLLEQSECPLRLIGGGLRRSRIAVSPEDACHHTERETRMRGRGASAHFDADLDCFKDFAFGGACGCCLLDVPLHA